MRIHFFQHTASEGPAGVARWAAQRGYTMTTTRFDLKQELPELADFDVLVVMGGPMNIYQYRDYPWLQAERFFIQQALAAGKKIVGFCLGSQLLADALGARVYQNNQHEIGWFPVTRLEGMNKVKSLQDFPAQLQVMHWHGDTFDLPAGAVHLASSAICQNQAFSFGNQAIGFQFHLEVDQQDLKDFIGCGSDLKMPGAFVQQEEKVWQGAESYAAEAQRVLAGFLDLFIQE